MKSALRNVPDELDLVLPGMIAGTVGSIVAPGGLGKSFLALEIAAATAGGPDLAGIRPPKTGDVLYLPAEDPVAALGQRLHAIGQHCSEEQLEALESRLTLAPLMGEVADVFDAGWCNDITEAAYGKRLVILDTIRRFHSKEENSSSEMAQLLGVLESICKKTGASILFVHHVGKGGDGSSQSAARGSSVLVDNVRGGQWNLTAMTGKEAQDAGVRDRHQFVKVIQAKRNYGPPIPDRWLERIEGGILVPAQLRGADDALDRREVRKKRERASG